MTAEVLGSLRSVNGKGAVRLIDQHGLRLDWLPAFGAGLQIHIEDLTPAGGPLPSTSA